MEYLRLKQLRLSEAIATYNAEHGADDYSDAVKAGNVYYTEISFKRDGRIIPFFWLGFKITEDGAGGRILDAVFAQKNGGRHLPHISMRFLAEVADMQLMFNASRFCCSVIRFSGRYGWQRYARSFGYTAAHERSSRGYPYFVKLV